MAAPNKKKRYDTEDNDEHKKFPKKTEPCRDSPGKNNKKHECEQCGKSYKDRKSLDRHVKANHNSEESYDEHKCEQCEKSFKYKFHLDRHFRTMHVKAKHNSEESNDEHKCEQCEKSFKYKFDLHRHVKAKHNSKESLSLIHI